MIGVSVIHVLQVCEIIEIVCLGFLIFRVIHLASFQRKVDFWKDKKNAVAIVIIIVSIARGHYGEI